MKEKILELRASGLKYREICNELGCSLSTVSYYCGVDQKAKVNSRNRSFKKKLRLIDKVTNFRGDNKSYGYKDVIKKFGENTLCSLTGESINLILDDDYSLDHIIPISRGGDNSIDNMCILKRSVNQAKHNLLNEEFIELCKRVVEYNT